MKLSIFRCKLSWLFVFLIAQYGLQAQQQPTKDQDSTNIIKFLSFQASLQNHVALGDNFANEALSQELGYNIAMRFYVYQDFFLGVEGGSFTANVEDQSLVGDYDSSNANTYGLTTGYTLDLHENHALDAALAFGFANYRNRKNDLDDRFVDNGNYFKVQLQYNYKFNQNVSLFALLSFRYDFLDIDTSSQIDDFLNEAQYFSFGFGFKFNVITDKTKLW